MDISKLNEQQADAVINSFNNNCVVVAGAGSGKSRVIVSRIEHMIEHLDVQPENIMVVTFTNKAAAELKHRISDISEDVDKMWIGTFHNICVRTLKKFGSELGIYNYTIMSAYESKSVIKKVMQDNNMPVDKALINNTASRISKCKNNLTNPKKMLSVAMNDEDIAFATIYQQYQDTCWKAKTFDFDDLIVYTVVLLIRSAYVREWFQENILYMMVDEFQDTNSSQFELIKLIISSNNLFLVGDADQCIYDWRGAKPEYLLNLGIYYDDTKLFKLEQNYRSTKTIVEASNCLIERNKVRLDRVSFSKKVKGDPIIYRKCKDHNDEANWIGTEIIMISSQNVELKNVAVLFRTNSQSRAIEEALMKYSIPYVVVGSLKFFDRKEIKDMLSFLKLKVNHLDEDNFTRSFGLFKGVGDKTVDNVKAYSKTSGLNFAEALNSYPDPKKHAFAMGACYSLLTSTIDKASEFIEKVLDVTQYKQDLITEDTPDSKARIENLEELYNLALELESKESDLTIIDFLNKISLTSGSDTESKTGAVSLMTFHSAKGLEFDYVFMAGMENNLLPHANAYTEVAIEAERRLAYVGVTRAKTQLYFTNAKSRMQFGGGWSSNAPSKFIDEIPKKYIMEV